MGRKKHRTRENFGKLTLKYRYIDISRYRHIETSTYRDIDISRYRDIDISRYRHIETSNQPQSKSLVPLQSGYPEQLQNSFPEFFPFLATLFIIGLPHFGQVGASAFRLCSLRYARRSAVRASVKPPSSLNAASWFDICLRSIVMRRLQRIIRQFASTIESFDCSHLSNLCF